MALPTVSAHHWRDDYNGPSWYQPVADSTCNTEVSQSNALCMVGYLCLDGSPPQVVDTALHCSAQAASHRSAMTSWAQVYAWATLDERSESAETQPYALNQTLAGPQGDVNGFLCGTVWSQFCSVPVWIPDHIPVPDPIRYYPL